LRPVVEIWPQLKQDYLAAVEQPMDFGSIQRKLLGHEYLSPMDFHADCM
jgi:Bromodomain